MDKVRLKAQSLLKKLKVKYGMAPKSPMLAVPVPEHAGGEMLDKEAEDASRGGADNWYLVDAHSNKFRLPKTMLFLGREECDVIVQSGTVDKRHAVITFDLYLNRFKVKDLSTTHGTYVNESRIPEQEYVTLNHMDSMRLGYDSKVYHIEQGNKHSEGSPSPPPLPSHAPPPLLTKAEAAMEMEVDQQEFPAWVSRHTSQMAECQGCIAEQKIEHTCTAGHSHHSKWRGEGASVDSSVSDIAVEPDASQRCQHDTEEQKPRLGRNTWPRKKVRQYAHVVSVFDEDLDMQRQAMPPITSNSYCVSVDDSVSSVGSGRSGSDTFSNHSIDSGSMQRIPRNSRLPLPPELETVKKGTPLYGQPAWWGDDTEMNTRAAGENMDQQSGGAKSPRPTSLVISPGDNIQPAASSQQQFRHSGKSAGVYMEISHRAGTPEQDKMTGRDKVTPARSLTSSISKDSLVMTPDSSRERSVDKTGETGNVSSSGSTSEACPNPSLSFTVEFGDEKKPKLNMSASLSQFVPPKIRSTLAQHARTDKAPASRPHAKETAAGTAKHPEERELSPGRQKKLEELWSCEGTRGRPSQRSTAHATGVPSLKSADFSADSSPEKSKADGDRKSKDVDKDRKARKTQDGGKSSPSAKVGKPKPASTAAAIAASVHAVQFSDPTAYLLDKMFAGSTAPPARRSLSSDHDLRDCPASPEHAMYREAAEYDRATQRGSATYRLADRPPQPPRPARSGSKAAGAKQSVVPADRAVRSRLVTSQGAPGEADNEDKVSEAGTYTIEADRDDSEEMVARQQIDEVFGVDEDSFFFERPIIGSLERRGLPDIQHDDDDDSRTPCQENSPDLPEPGAASMSSVVEEGEVPAWLSQLTALTSTHKTAITRTSYKGVADKMEEDTHKKPSTDGISRKRPGTGRKLPSLPTDRSPVDSEHSTSHTDISPEGAARSHHKTSPLAQLEHSLNGFDLSSARTLKQPNQTTSKTRQDGNESPQQSESSAQDVSLSPLTNGTRSSIDTELLLRDTETVMAAMEARMGFQAEGRQEDEGCDTDISSTVALANGDEDYIKPTKYHSPRENLTRKATKDKENSNVQLASRRSLARSFSAQKSTSLEQVSGSRRSIASVSSSMVSDILCHSDSLDESFQSETSSDRGDSSFSRSGSKGRGTITLTKPNRAFALRRARADGSEATETSGTNRTSSSAASSGSSSRRSSSVHSISRTPHSDRHPSCRTEASLGAQIVQKARENGTSTKRDSSSDLKDSRRNSLKGSRGTLTSASSSAASTKKERDLRTLKSHLKTGISSKELAITGISSHSQSQPGSRSGSPKAAERLAWKRRKEYDPRRAVAEAKAKARDGQPQSKPKPKPKVQPTLYKQRMIRSASFTNSAELSGRVRHDTFSVDSTSSVEDLSSAATAPESCRDAGFRRAFIPFHNPLRGDRLSHSADEDEAGPFPMSQDIGASKSVSMPMTLILPKSAFTPPLSKLHTPSPDSPPPYSATLLLRRRTLGAVDYEDIGGSTSGASSHRTQANSPQSYDSLIVSSVYQLSLKLKTSTDKMLRRLREQERCSITPSPTDDFLGHSTKSELPAWKSANQELAGVLKNLRKIEHHLQVIDRTLFQDEDTDTDISGMSAREKQKYFQEIERIRSELAGFQPIDTPKPESHDPGSPEMAEITQDLC